MATETETLDAARVRIRELETQLETQRNAWATAWSRLIVDNVRLIEERDAARARIAELAAALPQ